MEQKTLQVVGDATKARFISAIVDNLIAIFLTIITVGLVPENSFTLRAVMLVTVYLGYYFILEALWSRTFGKYFQGLVVRKLDGTPGDWKTALIRTLLRIVEVNPVLFGAIPAGLILISSKRKQRWGDMLAGSVVVSDKLNWNSESE
jgi:uncharacterized RDD family membrane protein YckC